MKLNFKFQKPQIQELYDGKYFYDKTLEWLQQTPNPLRIPELYTLTKIHKPTTVGRPIISGCDGPTERISAFVDKLLQPVAQLQKLYIKGTTDFINFMESKKFQTNTLLMTMDVTSLYTNTPQVEGIQIVYSAYEEFYQNNLPIPTVYIKLMLRLILQENSFKFANKHFLQLYRTAMGTKAAVAFANIFMAKIENQILQQSKHKPLEWVRFIDDIASFWDVPIDEVKQFIEEANRFHPTIKFTASISCTEATFLNTTIYKGNRFKQQGILDVQTHFSIHTSNQATHQVLKKVLSKTKRSDF